MIIFHSHILILIIYYEYYVHSIFSITHSLFFSLCMCSVIFAVFRDGVGDLFIECELVSICVLDNSVFDHGVGVGRIWRSFRFIRIGREAVIVGFCFFRILIELVDSSMRGSVLHSLSSKTYIYSLQPQCPNSLISDCLS